ncbi:MAG: 3-beta-hydroxysteroid dehydrogenase [Hydrocarboniphaga sp.]|uniref:SDR family oxidoreductase n=1 Tax=Hydrocarboniphaga sp. TaxID=2033016 RepID=UPI00262F71B3|nr:SDR family oxidoreductase [Hydrocarboniphaga sp.]MDB5967856.1 3-beta-hydroxysteroid dehydrogenase [Hydrocarboniphaga sp.]
MKGKVAIVTGAAHGIGRATAQQLVKLGASVVVADIDCPSGAQTASEIGEGAHFWRLDTGDEASWVELMAQVRSQFGRLDIVVNNAAVSLLKPIDQTSMSEWLHVFRVNAGGVFLGCKYAILEMQSKGGAIVNVSSNSSVVGMRGVPVYGSSKGAVNSLTRAVAAHCKLGNIPIRCNTVIPGGTRSKMAREAFLQMANIDINSDSPEGRAAASQLAEPETVAAAIVFLASDEAKRINGAELLADGADTLTFPQ